MPSWNSLSEEVVSAPLINIFKERLHKILERSSTKIQTLSSSVGLPKTDSVYGEGNLCLSHFTWVYIIVNSDGLRTFVYRYFYFEANPLVSHSLLEKKHTLNMHKMCTTDKVSRDQFEDTVSRCISGSQNWPFAMPPQRYNDATAAIQRSVIFASRIIYSSEPKNNYVSVSFLGIRTLRPFLYLGIRNQPMFVIWELGLFMIIHSFSVNMAGSCAYRILHHLFISCSEHDEGGTGCVIS